MENLITQTGVAGILIVLVLREVFGYLKTRREPERPRSDVLAELAEVHEELDRQGRLLDELHGWHNRMDADGVPVWYVRTSLEAALTEQAKVLRTLAENLAEQTRVLERLVDKVEETRNP